MVRQHLLVTQSAVPANLASANSWFEAVSETPCLSSGLCLLSPVIQSVTAIVGMRIGSGVCSLDDRK